MQKMQETRVWSLGWEDPLEQRWKATLVFLPGKVHGQRSLVGYSPWGGKELKMTEATKHTSRHAHMMHGVAKKEKKEASYWESRLWAALGQESLTSGI